MLHLKLLITRALSSTKRSIEDKVDNIAVESAGG